MHVIYDKYMMPQKQDLAALIWIDPKVKTSKKTCFAGYLDLAMFRENIVLFLQFFGVVCVCAYVWFQPM